MGSCTSQQAVGRLLLFIVMNIEAGPDAVGICASTFLIRVRTGRIKK